MLIKCMLPISLVENDGFKEYIEYICPSFNMPTRYTLKESLPARVGTVVQKIKTQLAGFEWLNISLDGWSDKVQRSFNGYVAQGIDNEWKMHTIPIAFQYVSGSLFNF